MANTERENESYDDIVAEKSGSAYWITLNRPAKNNALSLDMWRKLPTLITEAEEDPEVRVVILQGAGGKAFSAGADISEFQSLRFDQGAGKKYNEAHNAGEVAIMNCSKPTIAYIQGWCVGGGFQLAMACDMRIGTEESNFGITPSRLGIVYSRQSTERMVSEIGPAWTKLLLLTGRIISCEQALRLNIVQYAGDEAYARELLADLIAEIISGEPLSQFATKKFTTHDAKAQLGSAEEIALIRRSFENPNYKKAALGFLNKQKVEFSDSPAFDERRLQREE